MVHIILITHDAHSRHIWSPFCLSCCSKIKQIFSFFIISSTILTHKFSMAHWLDDVVFLWFSFFKIGNVYTNLMNVHFQHDTVWHKGYLCNLVKTFSVLGYKLFDLGEYWSSTYNKLDSLRFRYKLISIAINPIFVLFSNKILKLSFTSRIALTLLQQCSIY